MYSSVTCFFHSLLYSWDSPRSLFLNFFSLSPSWGSFLDIFFLIISLLPMRNFQSADPSLSVCQGQGLCHGYDYPLSTPVFTLSGSPLRMCDLSPRVGGPFGFLNMSQCISSLFNKQSCQWTGPSFCCWKHCCLEQCQAQVQECLRPYAWQGISGSRSVDVFWVARQAQLFSWHFPTCPLSAACENFFNVRIFIVLSLP